jgi:hypothetical protein
VRGSPDQLDLISKKIAVPGAPLAQIRDGFASEVFPVSGAETFRKALLHQEISGNRPVIGARPLEQVVEKLCQ